MSIDTAIRKKFIVLLLLSLPASAELHTAAGRVAGAQGIAQSPIAFSAVALVQEGAPQPVAVRSSVDRLHWSQWQALEHEHADAPGHLVFFGAGSRWLEWRAAAPVQFDITWIDPGETPPAVRAKIDRLARERSALVDKPPVVSRLEWGSPDGDKSRGAFSYTRVTHLIVHHTADNGPAADPAAWVRAIWAYHVNTNGWIDIGYNYLIAPNGVVFEGRAGGDDVLGAHFSCQNSGTMGVAVLGTYTRTAPPEPALDSLQRLLAWRASALNLDPLGSAFHAGMQTALPVIASHRDGNGLARSCTITECPGDALYPLLGAIREGAAALLAGGASLTENAESGGAGWTATGLWRISSRRAASGARAWWFGDESTGTFEANGTRVAGVLESPEFVLAPNSVLVFQSWHETESTGVEFDRKLVEIDVNGEGWRPLGRVAGGERQWVEVRLPVAAAGRARVRFVFDSVDGAFNRYEGWYVDEISVANVSQVSSASR